MGGSSTTTRRSARWKRRTSTARSAASPSASIITTSDARPETDAMTDAASAATLQAAKQGLRVQLAVRLDGTRLSVDASLANGTGQRVHVFNVLWDYAPTGAIAGPDSPAYVCIEGTELRFALRQLPLPRGRKMIVAIDPFLSTLDAGALLRQQLTFDVPVHEYSCYFRRE